MKPTTAPRHQARALALQILYGIDLNPVTAKEALRRFAASFGASGLDSSNEAFLVDLVEGTCAEREELDRLIAEASRNWRVSRMAAVDRNLLRLATYELLHHPEIPKRVTLNEAVELAKGYGTTESRAFINGVLDRVALLVPREQDG
ncbi:MAG: transcription antitermination factor NusB [Myxococcota bacterium]|jgi:N utilization substance protein B|nr:transcription antitermination factor NusB [Myxococcota bacterium]